jgi:prepilin-type N-terminal cleavage/methylation domain-containing protein
MINKSATLLRLSARTLFRVIRAQTGFHKAVQGLPARKFRLQATRNEVTAGSMTGCVNIGMTKLRRGLQAGFTLLEMILVLFLIGLMASATLMLTENVEDQAKYDETKRRMEMMRKAIVGDPTRTVNGSPEISGFVADMGRLPLCVRELIDQKDCAEPATPLTAWSIDTSTGIGFGWRGPYIQVLPERNGELHFRDGYGNTDSSTAIDGQNSGWGFDVSGAEINIDSNSFDITDISDDISANPLVNSTDWQISNIYINFINRNTSDALPTTVSGEDLNLRIYFSSITDYKTGDDGPNAALTLLNSAVPANSENSYLFKFDSSNTLPIGTHGYVVVCYETPSGSPDNYVLFDGDCNSASNAIPSLNDIRPFKLVPRQNMTLDWIIQ